MRQIWSLHNRGKRPSVSRNSGGQNFTPGARMVLAVPAERLTTFLASEAATKITRLHAARIEEQSTAIARFRGNADQANRFLSGLPHADEDVAYRVMRVLGDESKYRVKLETAQKAIAEQELLLAEVSKDTLESIAVELLPGSYTATTDANGEFELDVPNKPGFVLFTWAQRHLLEKPETYIWVVPFDAKALSGRKVILANHNRCSDVDAALTAMRAVSR